MQFYNLIMQ